MTEVYTRSFSSKAQVFDRGDNERPDKNNFEQASDVCSSIFSYFLSVIWKTRVSFAGNFHDVCFMSVSRLPIFFFLLFLYLYHDRFYAFSVSVEEIKVFVDDFCSILLVNGDDREKGLWTERFYRLPHRGSFGVLLSALFIPLPLPFPPLPLFPSFVIFCFISRINAFASTDFLLSIKSCRYFNYSKNTCSFSPELFPIFQFEVI